MTSALISLFEELITKKQKSDMGQKRALGINELLDVID